MQKTTIALMSAAVAALMAAPAAFAEGAPASAGVDIASAYVFRGGTVSDEVSVQPTLEGTFHGVTLGTWANFNTDASQFDEIDYYLGYELPLEDSPVSVSLGYTEYTYPTTGDDADREISVSFAMGDALFAPSLGVYYGIEGPFLDEGLYVELKGSHDFEVNDDITLTGGATLGYEGGDNFEENGVSYVSLSLGGSFESFSLSLNYVIETDDDVLAVDEEFYAVLSASL